jgi:hypothetical protein
MKPTNTFDSSSGRNVWVSGSVVIEGVLHEVKNKYIKCNPSLNQRAWDVTEEKERCPICFPVVLKREFVQLRLF